MVNTRLVCEPNGSPDSLHLIRLRLALKLPLPPDYEEFLNMTNGGAAVCAPLVIPFLELQDRVLHFRGARAPADPLALRPGELGDEVPDPTQMLVIADTKLGNPLALCLSPNDYGAVYYVLRNSGPPTSGTFALQRCWRLFENFTELCAHLGRPATRELTSGSDVTLGFEKDVGDHVTGLWTLR